MPTARAPAGSGDAYDALTPAPPSDLPARACAAGAGDWSGGRGVAAAVPATRRFPRTADPLEAQLVDDRAGEQDHRQHVEPDERDQHEDRASCRSAASRRSTGRAGRRSRRCPSRPSRRARPATRSATGSAPLGTRRVGDAERDEAARRRPSAIAAAVDEAARRRRARTAGRARPEASQRLHGRHGHARGDEQQHDHEHPEAEQLLAHPGAARQVVDAAERGVERAPERGADPQRGDERRRSRPSSRTAAARADALDQRALGRGREDRARVVR